MERGLNPWIWKRIKILRSLELWKVTRDREKKRTILTIAIQRDSCNISSLELKTWIKCVTKESGNNFDILYRKDLNQMMNRYLETNVTLQFVKTRWKHNEAE